MPIYEYECPVGHRFEVMTRGISHSVSNTLPCQVAYDTIDENGETNCPLIAERVWSKFSTLSDSKSTTYFVNSNTKEVRLAASDNDTNPIGFERKEAKGLGGRLKLEKDLQKQESEKQRGQHYAEVLTKNILTKKRHDNIRAKL
jgi:hypothetical protein